LQNQNETKKNEGEVVFASKPKSQKY